MDKGRFITLEGGEGAGKSTQVRLLKAALEDHGIEVVMTREPGGSKGAEEIRELLVTGEPGRWDGMTEALLNFAARRDHLVKTIWPALERGAWVISDRYADSTIAYQGYGHGLDLPALYKLWDIGVDGFRPDLTFVLDLPVETGIARALGRGDGEDRYEKMATEFHHKLRAGFLEIASNEPDRCCVIDASGSIEEIQRDMRAGVSKRFGVALP
ncbi:thymidylate kinase [Candidatus Terasakiella magnetica]|uniref:Thymidylate kinase n=1 Tax=Candidatus Terasakiella magnetica TaxID=1867952 RepID=A0A1C3RD41_9PROT|nr:dTMP kinase [Candidatus Terasakiella magnetica]SCA55185.1 thymidylate kinase [Candidatus Terasakiella magnetica]